MGIPHLFRLLARAHPKAVRMLHGPPPPCDALYIDFNAVIHGSARSASSSILSSTIERVVSDLKRIVRQLAPKKLLFLAIDGFPPRAKLQQQRYRRYVASWTRNENETSSSSSSSWDSNQVTPGTPFMAALEAALESEDLAAVLPPGCAVFLSGSTEDGEGEQKIFSDIRTRFQQQQQEPKNIVIHGLDADLLLMSALCQVSFVGSIKISIAREQDADAQMQLVCVEQLIKGISKRMAHPSDGQQLGARALTLDVGTDVGTELRIRDFVALCLLLGNDFIPGLVSVGKIKDGALDALLGAYRGVLDQQEGDRSRRLSHGGPDAFAGLNPAFLADVLDQVAKTEDADAARLDAGYFDRCRWVQRMPPKHRAPWEDFYAAERPSLQETAVFRPGHAWRPRYYAKLFGLQNTSAPDVTEVRRVSLAYLAGYAWTFAYFAQRCMCAGYAYPHGYAPSALDLRNALLDVDLGPRISHLFQDMAAEFPRPAAQHGALWQALLVLPPASLSKLDSLQHIYRLPEISHFFPEEFHVETYLHEKLHECRPILPHLDLPMLLESFLTISSFLPRS